MFSHIYYGNSLKEWLISFSIIVGAVVLNKMIDFVNKKFISKLTSKTNNRLDDILFKMLEAPVLLGIMFLAIWIASNRLILEPHIVSFLNKTYQFLIVINITWFVVRFVNALIEEYIVPIADDKNHKYLDSTLVPIIRRSILGVIWAIGFMMALKNIGVDVGALIAGLGIGGLAFALAAQDTIKNIFGGITIFTDRPFKIGENIKVDGFEGTVEDIGIRSTRLRTLQKRLVTIPNYKIVEASIENISNEPMRQIITKINLIYKTSPEKMNEALSILRNIPKIFKDVDSKDLNAVFSDFTDSSLEIKFIYWVKKSGHILETPSKVNLEILQSFTNAGLEFAYPTQTLYINKQNSGLNNDTTEQDANILT